MDTNTVQYSFFIGLLILVTVAFLALLSGFFQPIFWAATIGIVFLPVQHFLERKFHGRVSIAAVATVILIFFTVLVPAIVIAAAVANEANNLYLRIQSGEIDPAAGLRWLQSMTPTVNEWATRLGIDIQALPEKVSAATVKGSQFIGTLVFHAGKDVASFIVMFFLMLYLLFFVLRDGNQLLEQFIHVLPFGDERERALFGKFAEVARATIKGTFVVGLIQGSIGGVMFAALGIQGAVFWGVVMVLLSILPMIGASLVWIPAAIYLAVNGAFLKAAVMVAVGGLVIGLVDNILRPILVGRDTKMPDYLILLSTLGGLTLLGISGFVIGPIVASLFLAVWVMFKEQHAE